MAASSLDDILASMRASAPSAPAPPSHSWTQPEGCATANDPPAALPALDNAHRVAGGEALDYRFRCGAVRLSESEAAVLCADCSMAFALNSSNWLAATAEPRCGLERLARAIFEAHTTGVAFDPASSGAEWWAQVRTSGDAHEAIEFHWDCDEYCCDTHGVHVCPALSTVTYLGDCGAPTLVLAVPSPHRASHDLAAAHGPITAGTLSYPRVRATGLGLGLGLGLG